MKKQTKLILLIAWFVVAAAIYFSAARLEFEPIMPLYMLMSVGFGVAFFLVNGGLHPTIKTHSGSTREKLSKKQQSRLRYKTEKGEITDEKEAPRANIFRLPPKKQRFFAELFLILFLAPTTILVIDYVLIVFIPSYI